MPQYDLDSRDIVGNFYPTLETAIDGSWANSVATVIDGATQDIVTYSFVGNVPMMQQWIGERKQQPLSPFSLSITNVKYEATMVIDVADLRRDKTSQLQIRVGDLARRAVEHPQKLISTLIIDGDTTTSGLAYDGQQFFDTDHDESGSNQTNDLTSTEIPSANVTTATAPTPTEMANVISETIGYMYGYTDDQGEPVNGGARDFVIMCGTAQLYSAAIQAARLNALASGADNPLVGLRQTGVNVTPIMNPRLSANTDAIQIFRTDSTGYKPFIFQIDEPLTTQLLGAGSDYEVLNDAHLFGVKATYAAGYGAWNQAVEVTLS